ncbi:MAG: tryptophan 7-halogenase [Asticcacaulis sp.]
MTHSIRSLVIAGGGTAGWMCAAILSHYLPKSIRISLVESELIGTIGVGESTVPPFLELIRRLGINEQDFIQQTQASFKLGIRFEDWRRKGETYYHPFGQIGGLIEGQDFYQNWLRARSLGDDTPLQTYAPAAEMGRHHKFMLPFKAPRSPIASASFALHVDASLVAKYLRRFAEDKGVTRHEGMIGGVVQDARGFISALELTDGRRIEGDLFLDCTGFRALLIGKALGVGYIDWSDELLCDRAIAVQTENVSDPHPYTFAQAQDAGWRWRIPLQHRAGNGYVYSSRHISDEDATNTLMAQVEGRALTRPMVVPFKTGMRQELWAKNCVSVGLASGFIEPLESTAIHLIYRSMDFLLRYFPAVDCDANLIREYNLRMAADYTEIKDFVVLHYCLTQRDDTPFWRDVQAAPVAQSLREKIALFAENGSLREGVDELFRAPSWQSVMDGMGVKPLRHSPLVDRVSEADLRATLKAVREQLPAFVATLPSHGDFLRSHCPASP